MPESGQREGESRRRREPSSPLRRAGKVFELIGGGALCLLAAATPWLFGTTEAWSIRWMNVGSYVAGGLIALAAVLNYFAKSSGRTERVLREAVLRYLFLALNLAVLLFCAIALWNARATFSWQDRSFSYNEEYHKSLPTTYDSEITRETLGTLSAYFVVFWGLRYWLWQGRRKGDSASDSVLRNKRFLILTWVLSLNGFAVGIQGILQRLSGSAKLLWIRESWWGEPLACFGPFSYRGNAAEYMNMLWPLALGFWWVLSRDRRRRMGSARLFTDGPELLLIPAMIVMIAACITSLSRGGALIAGAILMVLSAMFLVQRNISARARTGFVVFVGVVLVAVWFLGWESLAARFKTSGLTDLSGREEIYRNAIQMTRDYPVFGTGPGSFRSVYHLYRQNETEWWHGFLHDDWLEMRVTFGIVGLALMIAHLLVLGIWFNCAGRPAVFYVFHACTGLGLLGLLVHAKYDFPFQTYSLAYTFVVICALLSSVSPVRK